QARSLGFDYGVYWSVGAAATRMRILPRAAGFALALAISATEKSPFRDIPRKYAEINQRTMNDRMINRLWPQFRSIYS
ncbi:MAG: ferredoxin domain-containing protein, partial [Desulfobacterales bacterium]|nr:ferredoxin domain-containing protein [Desulfobacterales bacterium]